MRTMLMILALSLWLPACIWRDAAVVPTTTATSEAGGGSSAGGPIIDQTVTTLFGEEVVLRDFRGKALLIVNTASACEYTPQYQDLQTLQDLYAKRGFSVLAFPCNDFGDAEPGTPEQIHLFCTSHFQTTFPLFEKAHVIGDKLPLFKAMTEDTDLGIRGEIRANFTKFLVDPTGHVVARFEPAIKPLDARVTAQIERVLPQ